MNVTEHQKVVIDLIKRMYQNYLLNPEHAYCINEDLDKYGWDIKKTANQLFDQQVVRSVVNNPLKLTEYYCKLSNKGIKILDPQHFRQSIETIEKRLVLNGNEVIDIEEASGISQPDRIANLTLELKDNPNFELSEDGVKFKEKYYNDNYPEGSSFLDLK